MSLAQHAKSAVLWNAGLTIFREIILRFGTLIVLRRLLEPADYGIFGFVNGLVGFLAMFAFNNFVAHVVQVRQSRDVGWQAHFTAGAFFQVPLFLLTNLVALSLRWIPEYARCQMYVHALSVLFLLDWPCEFRRKMLEREFNWARLRGLSAVGMFLGFLVALGFAFLGGGAYALLMPVLMFSPPFIYDLFVVNRWRPDWTFSWDQYQTAWRFGWTRTASGLAIRGRQFVEGSVVVARLGFASLGILTGAVGIAQMCCNTFTDQLLSSIYPVLTRVNPEPANISRVNGLLLRFVGWVIVPVAFLASALAGPLLLTLYGGKWTASVGLLPYAMALGLFAAFNSTTNTLLLAQERLRWCLYADLMLLAGTVIALIFALPHGMQAYLTAAALLQFLVFVYTLGVLVHTRALRAVNVLSALGPAVCASAVAVVVCEAVARFWALDATRLPVAAGYAVLFTVVCIALWRVLFTTYLAELLAYVPKRRFVSTVLRLPARAA